MFVTAVKAHIGQNNSRLRSWTVSGAFNTPDSEADTPLTNLDGRQICPMLITLLPTTQFSYCTLVQIIDTRVTNWK